MPGYVVGLDVGTTYTGAAVSRERRSRVVPLGAAAAQIPSVVFLGADGRWLVGEQAERRGRTEPDRLGREFKRRMGDQTPIRLGGTPQSAAALYARVLAWVLDRVAARHGGPAGDLVVTCPANWGGYKRDVLREALDLAEAEAAPATWPQGAVTVVTEPLAVATHYAAATPSAPGQVTAVYDLGGGTFDAAVVATTTDGHQLLGETVGVEQLGGIDFDDAVWGYVSDRIGSRLDELDPADPATVVALAALRRNCVKAKEALSADTCAAIGVTLPNLTTDIRLTRAEFEDLVRPTLLTTVTALRRALRQANVGAGDLTSIVLAGGSSRIPLVTQLLTAELSRPIGTDPHPQHTAALGATRLARPAAPVRTPATAPDPPDPGTPGQPDDPGPSPVATAEPEPVPPAAPVASAWRRARRLALVGLVAVTVAALGWLAVALTESDRGGEAREVAPTANERPESGGDGTDDATGREPLSRSDRSGGQADEDGDSASGSGSGSGTASTPDRPATTPRGSSGSPSTTAPGSPPATPPRGPATPGTTAPPGPSSVVRPWQDVTVGDCVNDLSPQAPPPVTLVEEVGCATPHNFEVMGILDKPPGYPYPGTEELRLEIGEYCYAIHSDVFPVRPELYLTYQLSYPTQLEWDRGIYRLTCYLGPAFGSRTTTGHLLP
jgi:actin-like ATPase involved in cell morphogenesis